MTNDDRINTGEELLGMAERLRELRARFDVTATKCGSCGLMHAHNYQEKKAAEQVDGAIGRLEKVIELLGSALDAEVQP